jgi:hypothetical protein
LALDCAPCPRHTAWGVEWQDVHAHAGLEMGGEVFEGKWCWVRAEGGAVAESERRYLLWLDVVVTQPTT